MPTYQANQPTDGFALFDEGAYKVTVEDAKDDIAASSGAELIKLTLAVEGQKSKLFDRLVFTDKAFWKIDQVRGALGFSELEGNVSVSADDFIGETGWVYVIHGEHKGKPTLEIDRWIYKQDEIEKLENGGEVTPEF